MRKLTREYGWSAAGVYFTLSVLDIPLCYLLVKTLGTERISEYVPVSAFGRTVQSLVSIVSIDLVDARKCQKLHSGSTSNKTRREIDYLIESNEDQE